MPRKPIPPGTRIARLIICGRGPIDKQGRETSICLCDCNKRITVLNANMRIGHTRSCGCFQVDMYRTRTKYGNIPTRLNPTYSRWNSMKARCSNPTNARYKDWGGRGITVCDRWDRFEDFLEDMGPAPDGMSIERIDNNGNYEPGNCKWATRNEQARNTRRTRLITIDGITACAKDHSDRLGINYDTLKWRLRHGWSADDAVNKPIGLTKKLPAAHAEGASPP